MRNKRIFGYGTALLVAIVIHTIPAQQEEVYSFPFSLLTLKNGLRVVLSKDDSLPLVSIVVAYNVGSVHDTPGKSGLAYLMEHLMNLGSRNVGQRQHISHLIRIGGEFNAETQRDKTIFSQTVPSNHLKLVLWLESDRMNSLSIIPSNVERAKNLLIEEIQYLKDSNPYRESALYFDQLLFSDFAYSHPIVGVDSNEVNRITLEDVARFYSTYYTPSNSVLSIAGNIDLERTTKLVRKYFESIPSGSQIPALELETPTQNENIEETFQEPHASFPGFYLGYRLASPDSQDYYVMSIIEYALIQGNSSRLYKRLVRERIANQIIGGIDKRGDFAAFKLFVLATNPVMRNRSRRAVFSEINKMRLNTLSERELLRAKNMFKADYIRQLESSIGKAYFLAESYLDRNNLEGIFGELNKYMRVTSSQILTVMNRYFTKGSIVLDIEIR
ncbi:MAG: pitrilysin family protein [Candidatus Aminicenantes bacterium]|jgi:predicted Zn-dependent peptidase